MTWRTKGLLVGVTLLLSACGGGLAGTYEDSMGLTQLRFERGGVVVQSSDLAGVERQMRYEMDGDRIRMRHPDVKVQPWCSPVSTRTRCLDRWA